LIESITRTLLEYDLAIDLRNGGVMIEDMVDDNPTGSPNAVIRGVDASSRDFRAWV